MGSASLDAFGELLIRRVRDVSIAEWDMIIDGEMKDRESQHVHNLLSSFDKAQLEIIRQLIPRIVDTTFHHLLYTFEQYDWIAIALHTEEGDISDIRQVAQGDLQGYASMWIRKFSAQLHEPERE